MKFFEKFANLFAYDDKRVERDIAVLRLRVH